MGVEVTQKQTRWPRTPVTPHSHSLPLCLGLKIFLAPHAMLSTKLVFLLVVAVQLASLVDGMGLCFGGYPACCQGGKNTCGPFCASCSRVGEFLRHMMMFDMRGFGKGTPAVFRLINPDPNAFPNKDPFPAQPVPTNFRGNAGTP